jgi:hypothetical protein
VEHEVRVPMVVGIAQVPILRHHEGHRARLG